MNPVAFYIFGIGIRWYGILIGMGLLLGILLSKFTCRHRNISFDSFLDIILISLPVGIIGARLYYVLFQFGDYRNHLIDIFNIRQGGLAIHGGILFAVITIVIIAKRKKMIFFHVADIAAPSVILAQAIGRWGNFMNGEAHGGPVSYDFISHFPSFIVQGMHIDGVYYQPTFLYESVWDLIVFCILIIVLKRSKKSGIVFFTYIGLYSLGRFLIEGLRTDSLMLGPFRIAQLVSLYGMIIWIVFLLLSRNKKQPD